MTEADIAAGGDSSGIVTKKTDKKITMTKRQRIKAGPNPSNTWPQMPKIQSPAARAKAYLRVAGLGGNSASSKAAAVVLDPSLDLNSPELKFGRLLAGTEERKRHDAVNKLERYIKARCDIRNETGGFSELDLLKLWKGLWYTLFLADKVPVQDELSKRLTELIWCVAGTEEEDEYAGQAYMDLYGDDTVGGFEGGEEEGDEDSEDVTMEEIHNSLRKHAATEEEEGQEESDGSLEEVELVDSEEEKGILGSDDGEEDDENEDDKDVDMEKGNEEVDDLLVPHCRGAHLASLFVKTFFQTVRREWDKMDKHRVDKFYTLVRLMMKQVYQYMAMRHWNIGIIRLFNDTLFEQVLSQTPNGLRFHLIDLCLEELVVVNANAPMPLTEATFLDCLEPYFAMAQTVPETVVHNRVMEKIFQSFLTDYSIISDAALKADEDENMHTFEEVHVGSVAQFIFELASDSETFDKYRKTLYNMHKNYMKLLKKVGKDVEMKAAEDTKEESGAGALGTAPEVMYDADAEHTEEEHADEIEESPPRKKKSSEKKKKKKRKDRDELMENVDEGNTQEEDQSSMKKSEKKKKKKARKSMSGDVEDPKEVPVIQPIEEDIQKVSTVEKKKKKDKKKEKKRKNLADKEVKEAKEDVITISVSEQKTAARAASTSETKAKKDLLVTPKKNKRTKGKKKAVESAVDTKRVSFGKVNHSKSYKASIKGLKTATPSTDKTPEKGILLKKEVVSTTGKRLKKKKKALDYF